MPVILYNLQENTEYEAVLRYNGINGAQCGSFTFTTLKDDRALTVSTINPDLHSIDFTVSLTGENLPEETYILYFIREKGEENWERYTQRVYGVDEYQYSISYYKNF